MKLAYGKLSALVATTAVLVAAMPLALMGDRDAKEAAVVTAMVRSSVERGDELTADRQFSAAREAYLEAADLVRTQGKLPIEAIRRISNAYYFEGSYKEVAYTLDRLAEEAAASGDIEAQAYATADAALAASLGSSQADANWRIERLEQVLGSPELSDEVREEIREKFMTDFVVFAPHLSSW